MRLKYFLLVVLLLLIAGGLWYATTIYSGFHRIKDSRLTEISGMTFSKRNPEMIWVHNDGGSHLKLYLIDENGNTRAFFKRKKSKLKDWEDIALFRPKGARKNFIYAGDIGDNDGKRDAIRIYRFPEPAIADTALKEPEAFFLKYPDGSRDAEAMMIDPRSSQLYIFSKREPNPGIYTCKLPETPGDTTVLQKVGILHLVGVEFLGWVTASAISPDGSQILIRTYGNVFYWKRQQGESVEQALQRKPRILKHKKEVQGEAIAFSPDGKGFYTISEGKFVPINYNRLPDE